MAWNTPTLAELVARVETDFSVRFFGTSAPLAASTLKVLARVWAMVAYLCHLYLGWIFNQTFAHLADVDQLPRHGQEIGVPQKAAAFATGRALFSGFAGPGGVLIPSGTLLQTTDGREYTTTEATTIHEVGPSAGSARAGITATLPGVGHNLTTGTGLSLVTTIPGVVTTTADGPVSGGADPEDGEAYRGRILQKKRNPPQGGAASDYVAWATSFAGVSDAWVFPNFPEANSVTLRIADRTGTNPTVTPATVAEVLAYITDPTRKPLTADVRVGAVAPSTVSISAQLSPLSAQVQASALAELQDLFKREGIPAGTVLKTAIQNTLTNTPGVEGVGTITITQDGTVVPNAVFGLDQIAGTVGAAFVALP